MTREYFQDKDQHQKEAETVLRELMGSTSDRLNGLAGSKLELDGRTQFYDAGGRVVENLIGARGTLFGLRRTEAGELELSVYAGAEAAKDRKPLLKMTVAREENGSRLTETRRIFDMSGAKSGDAAATIKTSLDRQSHVFTITARDKTSEQTVQFKDGMPVALDVKSAHSNTQNDGNKDERLLSFSFSASGEITGVSLNGKPLQGELAANFISEAKHTLATIARENGIEAPKSEATPDRKTEATPDRKPEATPDQKSDASHVRTEVKRDSNGRITRVEQPDGQWREFDRSPEGKVTAIRESNGTAFVSSDGKHFRMQGSNEQVVGTVTITEDGSYKFTGDDGTSMQRQPNGEVRIFSRDNKLLGQTSAEGVYRGYNQDGRLTESVDASGNRYAYGYKDGRLVSITEPDGAVFVSEDNKVWKRVAGPAAAEDTQRTGEYTVNQDGSLTFKRGDKAEITRRLDGSTVQLNEHGQPVCIERADGKSTTIQYDSKNEPVRLQYPSGDVWVRTGDNVWTKQGTGETWRGSVTVTKDGAIKEESGGNCTITRTDGWRDVRDSNGHRFEKSNSDGSALTKDEHGRVTATSDAAGQKRSFSYDQQGRLAGVSDAAGTWSSSDGINWTNDKSGSRQKGSYFLGPSGELSFRDAEKGSVTQYNTCGSMIVADNLGRITEVVLPNGQKRAFAYEGNELKQIRQPDQSVWTTADGGKTWKQNGTDKTRSFTASVAADGSYTEKDTATGDRLVVQPGGRSLKYDSNNRLLRDDKGDGSFSEFSYSSGKLQQVHRRLADGTEIWSNDRNQISKVLSKTGITREFGYDSQGKMNHVKDETGTWDRRDDNKWYKPGSNEAFIGQIGVTPEGHYIYYNSETATRTLKRTDGSSVLQCENPVSTRSYDSNGRLSESVDSNGNRKQYGYDAQGKLNRFVEYDREHPAGQIWVSKDGGASFTSEDGKTQLGVSLQLDQQTGQLTREQAGGNKLIERVDGNVIRISPEEINARVEALHKAIFPDTSITGNRFVDGALATTNPLLGLWTSPARAHLSRDWQTVVNVLQNMSVPEREALKQAYKAKYGEELEEHFKNFKSSAEQEKALNALNHVDGKVDYAGNIHAALTERQSWFFGRSTANCEKEIRDTISRLDSNSLALLKAEYQTRYGTQLDQALFDGNLSSLTKEALRIHIQGTDYIKAHPEETLKLADLAIKAKNVELVEEAFRSASPEARKMFKDRGGEQQLRDAFGGSWYNLLYYTLPGAHGVGSLFNANMNVGDTDLRHVLDAAEYGKYSAATQVIDNTTIIGDNRKAIENALLNMSAAERQAYVIGRAMTEPGRGLPPDLARMSDADKQRARDYYEKLHASLVSAGGIGKSAADVARWEDMIAVEGGSILSKVAAHCGRIYNDTDNSVVHDIETLSEKDWTYLHGLPAEQRQEYVRALKETVENFKGKALADLCEKLLNEKLKADTYKASESVGRRDVLDALTQNTHWYGNNKEAIFEAIEHMPADERRKYYTDANYKERLDRLIEQALASQPAFDAARQMLARGSVDKAPSMDPLDKLNFRIMQNDEQRRMLNLGASTLAGQFMSPLRTVGGGDRSVQMAGQASGLVTNYPGEAVRDLAETFQKDPKAYQEFKHKYDTDEAYRRSFIAAAHNLFPSQPDFDKYIQPLIDRGALPGNVLAELRRGVISDDNRGLQQDFTSLPEEERERLLRNQTDMDQAFRNLNAQEKEVSLNLLKQGKAEPEDLARACVIGFGTSKDELMAAWQKLSPEDREKAKLAYAQKYHSDIVSDLRGKIGANEAEDILDRPGTPEEAIDRILQRHYRSYDGIGRAFVDSCWDGTGYQARDLANQLTAMQAGYTAMFEQTKDNPEFRKKVDALVVALKDFKDAKEGAANAVVDAAMAIAAVAGTPFTGGVSLTLLGCTAVAGAALKVAIKAGMMGADYNWGGGQPLIDALTGAVDAATSILGPGEIAALCRIGERAGVATAETVAKELGEQFLKQSLKEGAQKTLETEMTALMRHSIATGARGIEDRALESIARKLVREGAGEEAVKALTAAMKKNLAESIAKESSSVLRQLAREYVLVASSGALGGGVSGTVRGATEWDRSKSVAENMQQLAATAGSSAGFGAAGAAGFHTIFKVGGAAYRGLLGKSATPHGAPEPHGSGGDRPGGGDHTSTRPGDKPQGQHSTGTGERPTQQPPVPGDRPAAQQPSAPGDKPPSQQPPADRPASSAAERPRENTGTDALPKPNPQTALGQDYERYSKRLAELGVPAEKQKPEVLTQSEILARLAELKPEVRRQFFDSSLVGLESSVSRIGNIEERKSAMFGKIKAFLTAAETGQQLMNAGLKPEILQRISSEDMQTFCKLISGNDEKVTKELFKHLAALGESEPVLAEKFFSNKNYVKDAVAKIKAASEEERGAVASKFFQRFAKDYGSSYVEIINNDAVKEAAAAASRSGLQGQPKPVIELINGLKDGKGFVPQALADNYSKVRELLKSNPEALKALDHWYENRLVGKPLAQVFKPGMSLDEIHEKLYEIAQAEKMNPVRAAKELRLGLASATDAEGLRVRNSLDELISRYESRQRYRYPFDAVQTPPGEWNSTAFREPVDRAALERYVKGLNLQPAQCQEVLSLLESADKSYYTNIMVLGEGADRKVMVLIAEPSYGMDKGAHGYLQMFDANGKASRAMHLHMENGKMRDITIIPEEGGTARTTLFERGHTPDPALPNRLFGFSDPAEFVNYLESVFGKPPDK